MKGLAFRFATSSAVSTGMQDYLNFDEIGEFHVLAVNAEHAFVVLTLDALCLSACGHFLVDDQATVQVDLGCCGLGFFLVAGGQKHADCDQRQ